MKLAAAVIGAGAMGSNHARIYHTLPETELVAVVDTDESHARHVADRYHVPWYTTVQGMLDKHRLDAVTVAVPTSLHAAIASQMIHDGIHVLVEKPLAPTSEECARLCSESREAGVILMVGHVERYNPAVRKLHQLIREGIFGEITSIIIRRVGLAPPRIRDADVITDLAVHDIDIANHLLGMQPVDVYANSGYGLLRDRFDFSEVFLNYGSCNAIISVNWLTPLKIRKLSVTGARGYAELDFVRQELLLYRSPSAMEFDDFSDFLQKYGSDQSVPVPVEFSEPLAEEIRHFIRCIKSRELPETNCEQALQVIKIVETIHRQHNSRKA